MFCCPFQHSSSSFIYSVDWNASVLSSRNKLAIIYFQLCTGLAWLLWTTCSLEIFSLESWTFANKFLFQPILFGFGEKQKHFLILKSSFEWSPLKWSSSIWSSTSFETYISKKTRLRVLTKLLSDSERYLVDTWKTLWTFCVTSLCERSKAFAITKLEQLEVITGWFAICTLLIVYQFNFKFSHNESELMVTVFVIALLSLMRCLHQAWFIAMNH